MGRGYCMKILIVDDEKLIRNGLRTIIEEKDPASAEVFEACCGSDAIHILSKHRIDLAITDIRMPGMDGITFMKEAHKLNFKPEFVILTGYDDFQYARESIKYGAKAYLLKPVRKAELYEVLNKLQEELQRKKNEDLKIEKMNDFINDVWEHELNYVIMNDSLSAAELENITDIININVVKGSYYVGIMERKRKRPGSETWNNDLQLKTQVTDFYAGNKFTAVAFYSIEGSLVSIAETKEAFYALARYLRGDTAGGRFVTGISGKANGVAGLGRAYLQACEALKYRIIRMSEELICFEDMEKLEKNFNVPVELFKRIMQLIGTKRINEINDLINKVFDQKEILPYNVRYLEKLVEAAYRHVIEPFSEQNPLYGLNMQEMQYEYLKSIYNFDHINDYIYAFKKYVFDINTCFLDLTEVYKDRNEIDAALDYISNNYQKDLNLAVVANHVSLNYSYFSNLFSEKTGDSFHNYLKKVRIEKAKELLKNSDYKINEVAEKVGYKNPKHFATNFRALTGISPMEYRYKVMV